MPTNGEANDCSNDTLRVCRKANGFPLTCQLITRYTAKPAGMIAIQNHCQFQRRLPQYCCAASTASVGTRIAPAARLIQQIHSIHPLSWTGYVTMPKHRVLLPADDEQQHLDRHYPTNHDPVLPWQQ